jgi:hypothetical protein
MRDQTTAMPPPSSGYWSNIFVCEGDDWKIRVSAFIGGLAISFALPTYSQQKDVADPQTTQKLLALTTQATMVSRFTR